jgi:ADP-ribose pyrophosphatase YjhB (NUDIX family)
MRCSPFSAEMSAARSYPDRPYVGVGIVVFRGKDVLLVKRGDRWSIPGGAQELGETVRETALRELKEETCVDARLLGLIDVVDGIQRDPDGRVRFHYTLVDFAAEWVAGEAAPASDVSELKWFELAGLDALGMWAETLRIIRAAERLRDRPRYL